MNSQPTVTVIIIFLNGEQYIAEAIDSVLAQTFNDWELLLCDDGSTDGATAIARDYAVRHPGKIRFLEHPNHENRGMSATRMLGVHNSSSKFISWLDADDYWVPQKLAEQMQILRDHPEAAMVYGPMKLWYSWSGKRGDENRDFVQTLGVRSDSVVRPPELTMAFLRDPMKHPSGVLVRRSVLMDVGGYEAPFRGEYEDVIVQSKVTTQYPVYASSRCWYWYRQHEKSCTAATRRRWEDAPVRFRYLERFDEFLREKGMTAGPVWDEVQRQLKPYRNKVRYFVGEMVRLAVVQVKGMPKYVLPGPVMTWLRTKRWRRVAAGASRPTEAGTLGMVGGAAPVPARRPEEAAA
jgi:glycosyltransferase involved in cell wall biosynthesis